MFSCCLFFPGRWRDDPILKICPGHIFVQSRSSSGHRVEEDNLEGGFVGLMLTGQKDQRAAAEDSMNKRSTNKVDKQAIHDIGVVWYHCGEEGCKYKANLIGKLKLRKKEAHDIDDVQGSGFLDPECSLQWRLVDETAANHYC